MGQETVVDGGWEVRYCEKIEMKLKKSTGRLI